MSNCIAYTWPKRLKPLLTCRRCRTAFSFPLAKPWALRKKHKSALAVWHFLNSVTWLPESDSLSLSLTAALFSLILSLSCHLPLLVSLVFLQLIFTSSLVLYRIWNRALLNFSMAIEEEAAAKENDGGISTNEVDPSSQKVPHLLLLVEFCDVFSDICIFLIFITCGFISFYQIYTYDLYAKVFIFTSIRWSILGISYYRAMQTWDLVKDNNCFSL